MLVQCHKLVTDIIYVWFHLPLMQVMGLVFLRYSTAWHSSCRTYSAPTASHGVPITDFIQSQLKCTYF